MVLDSIVRKLPQDPRRVQVFSEYFVLFLCIFFVRFDPYAKLARVTGMATTEAVFDFFLVNVCAVWPTGLRLSIGHSVCKSHGPTPHLALPDYPICSTCPLVWRFLFIIHVKHAPHLASPAHDVS